MLDDDTIGNTLVTQESGTFLRDTLLVLEASFLVTERVPIPSDEALQGPWAVG